MDIVQKCFGKFAIRHKDMWLYSVDISKKIVHFCRENGIKLLGMEAFLLFDNGKIQPSMENSLWFAGDYNVENYQTAIDYLSLSQRDEYVFEMWYDGYS